MAIKCELSEGWVMSSLFLSSSNRQGDCIAGIYCTHRCHARICIILVSIKVMSSSRQINKVTQILWKPSILLWSTIRILSGCAQMTVLVTPLLCSSWLKSLTVALTSLNPGWQHMQGGVGFCGDDELVLPGSNHFYWLFYILTCGVTATDP